MSIWSCFNISGNWFWNKSLLNEYEIDDKVISNVQAALTKNGYTAMGENANITLDKVERILNMSINA